MRPSLLACVLLTGCTEPEVQWYGFWLFCLVLLVRGAVDLWQRFKK